MNYKVMVLALVFSFGYIANDIIKESNISVISSAKADVAGMDAYDLRTDYDFKKAVKHIVSNCWVDVSGESISCY